MKFLYSYNLAWAKQSDLKKKEETWCHHNVKSNGRAENNRRGQQVKFSLRAFAGPHNQRANPQGEQFLLDLIGATLHSLSTSGFGSKSTDSSLNLRHKSGIK